MFSVRCLSSSRDAYTFQIHDEKLLGKMATGFAGIFYLIFNEPESVVFFSQGALLGSLKRQF